MIPFKSHSQNDNIIEMGEEINGCLGLELVGGGKEVC